MRKAISPLIIGIAVLTGCTTEVVREVEVTQTTEAPQPRPSTPSSLDYARYLQYVNSQSLAALSISDYDLTTYGDGVCELLDQGEPFSEIVSFLGDGVLLTDDEAALIASVLTAAVVYLCPEYESEMNQYINSI